MNVSDIEGVPTGRAGEFRFACQRCGMSRVGSHSRETHYCGVDLSDETHPIRALACPKGGPGSELKALLGRFGIHASPTCKCNSTAKKMDDMGPDWSLLHIEEIVDVMEETARARKLPFLRTAGRLLVKKAVRNWQKKATGK